jgi:hypothetical protein
MKKWKIIIILAALVAIIGTGVEWHYIIKMSKSGALRFESQPPMTDEQEQIIEERVKRHLLKNSRLISAYALPGSEEKRASFHKTTTSWPIYGVKGSEFEGTAISVDYIRQSRDFMSLWISVALGPGDVYSKKIRDLKALITEAIGKEDIKNFTVTFELWTPPLTGPGG